MDRDAMALPTSLGSLRAEVAAGRVPHRSVKDELRENVIARLRAGRPLFPGIIGFDDTVVPQVVNAILSRHNFILLGLRGQAKTRLLRGLLDLLDEQIPVMPGCEIHDDPLDPICAACRARVTSEGDDVPVAWRQRDHRYVEKLATPDVTIADMIGDVDPIKAVRSGRELGDELTMHYGLVPRANRGIFAINELPDLASKVQVGLFNILQEGDVQIKGYPVRLRLDVAMVFSANPEDYTARGKIITPLKDRIGSEIRTHYPRSRPEAMSITAQEAWIDGRHHAVPVEIPAFVREVVEEIAFQARRDQKVDKRSGVSQRLPITTLESVVSNAERRALINRETVAVPRVADIYASRARKTWRASSFAARWPPCSTAPAPSSTRGPSSTGSSAAAPWNFPTLRRRSNCSGGWTRWRACPRRRRPWAPVRAAPSRCARPFRSSSSKACAR
jgi:magnesium chelatase subunit I